MIAEATAQSTVCSKGFMYRKNKQFCSNTCKQQAYLKNKASVPLQPITAQRTPRADFSLKEHEEFNEVNDWDFSMLYFCFFQRNLPNRATLEQINSYTNRYRDDLYDEISSTKAYSTFKEDFLRGKHVIG